jgi:hypothetical protein
MRRKRNIPESGDEQNPLMMENEPYQPGNVLGTNIVISCQELLRIPSANAGYCSKKNNSVLAVVFPCCYSKWKTRYIVLLGNYLYRFESENSGKTKGIPIPIDSATINLKKKEAVYEVEIKTIRKNYLLIFDNNDLANDWYKSLQSRKILSIQENLGHSVLSAEVKKYNAKSDLLFKRMLYNESRENTAHPNSTFNPLTEGLT